MMPDYQGLSRALLPELSLVVGALLVIAYDLIFGRNRSLDERARASAAIGSLAIVFAAWHVYVWGYGGPVFGQVLMFDPLALMTRAGVLLLALLTLATFPATALPRHPAEYVAVVLFATTGFTLMAAAQQLLLVFLAIELASISLYVLAGFDKSRPESAEAGLKYFLFGGMAAAFLLFGFSLLYGLTGSIELPRIATALHAGGHSPLLAVALVMIVVAFGFKAAAAPFHLWAPDVYQGAPASSAALIASASKLAGATVFTRLLWDGLSIAAGPLRGVPHSPGWLTILAIVAGASLLLGNLAALAQAGVRRLLAYSAIGHAGVLLLAVITAGRNGVGPLFYYALTYGLATVGAFGVIGIVERQTGRCDRFSDLAGLSRRSPWLAGCLAVFILSLAGIPPLAGFLAKFAVFSAALQTGTLASPVGLLTLLAIALSAVALYYYLLILKAAWVSPPEAGSRRLGAPLDALPLVVAAGLLVVLGVFPDIVLHVFH